MSLKYEPASEPLHISAKWLTLNPVQVRLGDLAARGRVHVRTGDILNPQPVELIPTLGALFPEAGPSRTRSSHNPRAGYTFGQVYPGKPIFLSFDGNENYYTIRSY